MNRTALALLLVACGSSPATSPGPARATADPPLDASSATEPDASGPVATARPEPEPADAGAVTVTCAALPKVFTAAKVQGFDANIAIARKIYASANVDPRHGADVTTEAARRAWLHDCVGPWRQWRTNALDAGDERIDTAKLSMGRAGPINDALMLSAEAWTAFAEATIRAAEAGDSVDSLRVTVRTLLDQHVKWMLERCSTWAGAESIQRCQKLHRRADDLK